MINKLEQILNGEIKIRYNSSLRKQILNKNIFEYKCNRCGIKDWNNEPITLEIEHKDGDNWNNVKENLELLCPNCHSQTTTYRRNRKIKITRINKTDFEILEQIKISNNINQVLLNLELSNSGGNYKRVHNIIKENNLESFYDIPKIIKKEKIYKRSNQDLLNDRLKLIKDSNIDFGIKGWGVKLGKHLNLTPYAAISWVKKNLPEFYKDCFKHIN